MVLLKECVDCLQTLFCFIVEVIRIDDFIRFFGL